MKMNLTGAIEILKLHKHTTDKFKHSVGDQYVSDAIDTVVEALEKHLPTDEEIEANGIEGGLRDGELQMFWEGAKWMRDKVKEEKK